MKNTIKRDQLIIQDMVSKYGKADVIKYVNKIDESFEDMMAGLNSTVFKDIIDKHENEIDKKNDVETWLANMGITKYELFFDYSIKLDQDVDFSGWGLSAFPEFIRFRECGENCRKFDISNNDFTSTSQLPRDFLAGVKDQSGMDPGALLNISGNKFGEIYSYLDNLRGNVHVDIRNNPDLVIHYEYVRNKGNFIFDESQRKSFLDSKKN